MRFHIYKLSQQDNTYTFKEMDFRSLTMYEPKPDKLKIDLIEISGVKNPTDLGVEVSINYERIVLKMHRVRHKMLLQNDIFVVDVSDMDFGVDISKIKNVRDDDVYIRINYDSDFEVKLYCSTNQKPAEFHTEYL